MAGVDALRLLRTNRRRRRRRRRCGKNVGSAVVGFCSVCSFVAIIRLVGSKLHGAALARSSVLVLLLTPGVFVSCHVHDDDDDNVNKQEATSSSSS